MSYIISTHKFSSETITQCGKFQSSFLDSYLQHFITSMFVRMMLCLYLIKISILITNAFTNEIPIVSSFKKSIENLVFVVLGQSNICEYTKWQSLYSMHACSACSLYSMSAIQYKVSACRYFILYSYNIHALAIHKYQYIYIYIATANFTHNFSL